VKWDFLRQGKVCIFLGTWHPFKVVCEAIQKHFLCTFLAPAFHAIFPDFTMLSKMRLSQLLHLINMLMLSYPKWKDKLKSMVDSTSNQSRMFGHLQKLTLLFEYFLPVVCDIFLHTPVSHVHKVLDYGHAIRNKDLHVIIQLQLHLAVVFQLLVSNRSQYCPVLLYNATFMVSLMRENHPVIKFIQENPHMLNEEDGEVALSRASQTTKVYCNSIQYLRNSFISVGTHFDVAANPKKKRAKSHVMTTADDSRVAQLVEHFGTILDEMKNRTWTYYKPLESKEFKVFSSREKQFVPCHPLNINEQEKLVQSIMARLHTMYKNLLPKATVSNLEDDEEEEEEDEEILEYKRFYCVTVLGHEDFMYHTEYTIICSKSSSKMDQLFRTTLPEYLVLSMNNGENELAEYTETIMEKGEEAPGSHLRKH
jgi:hypothetical protein